MLKLKYCSNGKIALEMMDETEFNLVLTDIHMPEMNGREFLKHLRSIVITIGIVVLTAFL